MWLVLVAELRKLLERIAVACERSADAAELAARAAIEARQVVEQLRQRPHGDGG